MRFLIDANLPRWFASWSSADFSFVHDLGPRWSDTEIWSHALANDLVIVSKDADFTARALAGGKTAKVIHVRLGNLPMRRFHAAMTPVWPVVSAAIEDAAIVLIYRDRIETIA